MMVDEERPAPITPSPTRDALVAQLRQESMPALVARYRDAYAELTALLQEAAPYQIVVAAIQQVWQEQLTEQGGLRLPTGDPGLIVQRELGDVSYERNNYLLRDLLNAWAVSNDIPRVEIDKCVYFERPKEPVLRSDLRALQSLAKLYGKPVQDIIDRCFERRRGPSRFTVTLREAVNDDNQSRNRDTG